MDTLDEMTLRKRRDRLFNPNTATRVYLELEMAMFHYMPPPPVPPPYVFNAPQVFNNAAFVPPQPQAPDMMGDDRLDDIDDFAPANVTGVKRELPEPQYSDRNEVRDDVRARPNPRPPLPPGPPIAINLAQRSRAPPIAHPAGQHMYMGPISRPGAGAA